MDNTFVRVALYAYPFLETVDTDYDDHIKNKALLSYRSAKSAEQLALELALEIVEKDKLVRLKRKIETALNALDDTEKTLVAVRYFGKRRNRKKAALGREAVVGGRGTRSGVWSERKYFRVQNRLCEKIRAIFVSIGLSREVFEREYAPLEMFQKIYAYVKRRGEKLSKREREEIGAAERLR